MSVYSGTLASRSVHPASPFLLTKNVRLSRSAENHYQLREEDAKISMMLVHYTRAEAIG